MLTLEKKLEAVLFYKAEPEKIETLATLLNVSAEELKEAAHALSASLVERGIQLLWVENQIELVTSPEASDLLRDIRKAELVKELGKAGSETLAIILYRGPATRAEIDYIRGVNSTFILRNLQVRGLVERARSSTRQRSFVYAPTPELLKHLGVRTVEELADYASLRKEIEAYEIREQEGEEKEEQETATQTS